jgi:hypothetical protein
MIYLPFQLDKVEGVNIGVREKAKTVKLTKTKQSRYTKRTHMVILKFQ